MNIRKVATHILGLILVVVTLGLNAERAQAVGLATSRGTDSFAVDFVDCVESIGVTLVPTASARAYVPDQFILAGDGQPVTPLVVRTARCGGIAVDGQEARPGEILQIGAVIIPPDGTGDINNYTIWYYTSDPKLATELRRAGVDTQHVPTIDYNYQAGSDSFSVHVPRPGNPQLDLAGTVQPSPDPAGSFLANWWQQTADGVIKMGTNVPVINIGGANLSLTTDPNDALGQLIGASSSGFPIIQQFNQFATARMAVTTP